MKRKTLLALMALVMSVSLCACGEKEEEVVPVATVEEIPIVEETTVEEETTTEEVALEDELPEGMYFSELTNEPIDESLKNQRPIAAMVDKAKESDLSRSIGRNFMPRDIASLISLRVGIDCCSF